MQSRPEQPPVNDSRLSLLLTSLVDRVADLRHAIVLSEDGLVISRSTSLDRTGSERLAATASALMSLGSAICADAGGGGVLQVLIEMRDGFLVLTSAGRGTHLAVLAASKADIGVVAFEMNMLVKKIGAHLGAAPRIEPAS
ncbi:roadblock/LC7 domain-containing protein [Streptomyces sp. NPDC049887]|uniref:roadblock/LC7 domain-containing protein n=1 Tax=Streptomyces TaxID=1883 RepID=UPI00341596EA